MHVADTYLQQEIFRRLKFLKTHHLEINFGEIEEYFWESFFPKKFPLLLYGIRPLTT